MATIKGTNNADTKNGTTAADTIYGYGGNDSLNGKAGDDQIWGGTGHDKIWGDIGNDILRGEDGDDFAYGGVGNDVIYGGIGNDSLYGDAGTDTVKGDAGNDTIKSGTGIGYLYGGDGNDSLYYDPTTDNIASVKSYLSGSLLDGDAGTDTLNIYNNAKYIASGVTKTATTEIVMDGRNSGDIFFENPNDNYYYENARIDVGHFQEVEKITVTGAGKLEFNGSYSGGKGIDITGTAGNDVFNSYAASDTLRGGAGNDDFHLSGFNDVVVSTTTDADRFYFDASNLGSATITGFNGVGTHSGDRIYFDDGYNGAMSSNVVEENGKTEFTVETNAYYGGGSVTVTVDKTGLVEGVDYFSPD